MAMETTVAKSVTLGIHLSKTNVGGCFGFCKQQPTPQTEEPSYKGTETSHIIMSPLLRAIILLRVVFSMQHRELKNPIKTIKR